MKNVIRYGVGVNFGFLLAVSISEGDYLLSLGVLAGIIIIGVVDIYANTPNKEEQPPKV